MFKIFIGLIIIFLFSGCSTVYRTSEGFAKGIYEDSKNFWNGLKKLDSWWREHTW